MIEILLEIKKKLEDISDRVKDLKDKIDPNSKVR